MVTLFKGPPLSAETVRFAALGGICKKADISLMGKEVG